jgi:hypothetical protein
MTDEARINTLKQVKKMGVKKKAYFTRCWLHILATDPEKKILFLELLGRTLSIAQKRYT